MQIHTAPSTNSDAEMRLLTKTRKGIPSRIQAQLRIPTRSLQVVRRRSAGHTDAKRELYELDRRLTSATIDPIGQLLYGNHLAVIQKQRVSEEYQEQNRKGSNTFVLVPS